MRPLQPLYTEISLVLKAEPDRRGRRRTLASRTWIFRFDETRATEPLKRKTVAAWTWTKSRCNLLGIRKVPKARR